MSKVDDETRQLAAMAYGEASPDNVEAELQALASILVRQRDARGYKDIASFARGEPTFSFVVNDGNKRYAKLMKASDQEIEKDAGMRRAVAAAKNALAGGPDMSNGGWFWDGADIKTNYKNHFKVKQGIRFSDPSHNIYDIKESTKVVILYKRIKVRDKNTGTVSVKQEEIGRYDHVYQSTAAHGGTIFWRLNPEYLRLTRAKEYK